VKPGKGGAFVRTKIKNLRTGRTLDKTFRAGEKVELAEVEDKRMQYLYLDGESLVFMDTETYDQIPFSREQVGDAFKYLKENIEVDVVFWKGNPISIKPATLETGAVIQVPLFIKEGELVRVDTRTGAYVERVN
jgi:elongation factor P